MIEKERERKGKEEKRGKNEKRENGANWIV
jgi:hypothetical protein